MNLSSSPAINNMSHWWLQEGHLAKIPPFQFPARAFMMMLKVLGDDIDGDSKL